MRVERFALEFTVRSESPVSGTLTYIIFLLNTYLQTYERIINIFLLNRVCYYRGGYSKGKIHQRKIEKMERALVEKINPHWSDLAWVVASL